MESVFNKGEAVAMWGRSVSRPRAAFLSICFLFLAISPASAQSPFNPPKAGGMLPLHPLLCDPGFVWFPGTNRCVPQQLHDVIVVTKPPRPIVAGRALDIEPASEADMAVTLSWGRGTFQLPKPGEVILPTPSARVDYYKVCVWDGDPINADCDGTAVPKQIVTNLPGSRTMATVRLDHRQFQGRSVSWSVAACSCAGVPTGGGPLSACQDPMPDRFNAPGCTVASATQRINWMLPPPTGLRVSSNGRDPGSETAHPFDRYTFSWDPVWARSYYRLCLYDGTSIDACLARPLDGASSWDANPLRLVDSARQVPVNFDLPQFRGKQVQWTVAACAEDLPPARRCRLALPQPLAVADPLNPPVIESYQVSENLTENARIAFGWRLTDRSRIAFVRLCIADMRYPGSPPRAEIVRACEARNRIIDPDRAAKPTGCAMRYPFFAGQFGTDPVYWGFMVAACNGAGECFWSQDYAGAAYARHEAMPRDAVCD